MRYNKIMETTMTEREALLSEYSDAYKDARGFRPRGIQEHLDLETLRLMVDDMHAEAAAAAEQSRREEQAAVIRFEARLETIIASGAGDRETALRWLLEGEDTTDLRMLEWSHGLPHRYLG